jgi:hypothetical protein
MSKVRRNIRDRQTMRSFDVDGIISDISDRL